MLVKLYATLACFLSLHDKHRNRFNSSQQRSSTLGQADILIDDDAARRHQMPHGCHMSELFHSVHQEALLEAVVGSHRLTALLQCTTDEDTAQLEGAFEVWEALRMVPGQLIHFFSDHAHVALDELPIPL